MRFTISPSLFILIFAACLCQSGAARADDEAQSSRVTFYKDVLPILQNNCQECHREAGMNYGGMIAPMALTTYSEVRPWAKGIAQQVKAREMPPWDADIRHRGVFSNERSLTDEEIGTLAAWSATGAARGRPEDAPEPRVFASTDGWMIGEPDLIVTIPQAYFVKDDVVDVYTGFSVDLTEDLLPHDMWITGFQCKPGVEVIHHFNAHLLAPVDGRLPPQRAAPESETLAPEGAGTYIGGTASGTDANRYPEGFGLLLKQGTRVTFDIHYHKEPGPGTGVTDSKSQIGFLLTSTPPTRRLGSGLGPLSQYRFSIPPGDPYFQVGPVRRTFRRESEIVSLMPHMHLRGIRARFELLYPDGTREIILDVPKYDFSWQTVYYFKELKHVPAGTEIEFTAWYDNSPERAAERNFDAAKTITFGRASTDEMMMGFVMSAAVPEDGD